MRISYSSLENFKQCPLKYKFANIDHLKEPKSKEAVFGNYIHQVLKWFYQQDPHFPTLENLLGYYYNHWPASSKDKGDAQSIWQTEKEEKDYFQEGMRILEEYYKKNFPPKSMIMDLETKFEVVVDETPNEPGGKHILTGIIDRIDKLPNGSIEIIDYKTSKRIPSQNDVNANFQLSIYALGLQKKWPKIELADLHLSLYFLKFNEKIKTQKTQDDIAKTQERIIDLIHQIEKSSFEPKSSPLCNWCGYRPLCPVWRHFYEGQLQKEFKDANIEEKIDEYFQLQEDKTKIEQKLKELKNFIEAYSRQKGLKRVFGNNGYFNQETASKISFDKNQLKAILEPLGKWDEILAVDMKKLEKVIREIPPPAREEIKKTQKIKKEYKYLEANNISKEELEKQMRENI